MDLWTLPHGLLSFSDSRSYLISAHSDIGLSAPATAKIVQLTMTGVVGGITDPGGLLGSPAAGTPYTLVYRVDFSRGAFTGGGGGFGSSNAQLGGTSVAPVDIYPTITLSPVSAMLTVAGQSLGFAGVDYGSLLNGENSYDVMFGGTGGSWSEADARDVAPASGGISDEIFSRFDSDVFQTFDTDVGTPISFVVDGTHFTGSTTFTYSNSLTGTAISGSLAPQSYTIAAIPEPLTWATLTIGFAVAGMAMRDRRGNGVARVPSQRRPRGSLVLAMVWNRK